MTQCALLFCFSIYWICYLVKERIISLSNAPLQSTESFQPSFISSRSEAPRNLARAASYCSQTKINLDDSADEDTYYDATSKLDDGDETAIESATTDHDSSPVADGTTKVPKITRDANSNSAPFDLEITEAPKITSEVTNDQPQEAIDEEETEEAIDEETEDPNERRPNRIRPGDVDLANELKNSIKYIQLWLELHDFDTTIDMSKNVTHEYNDNIRVAKKFLKALLADTDTNKFREIMDSMYKRYNKTSSSGLADSFAVVIMWALGFPEKIDEHSYSYFRKVKPLILDALCASRDMFFFTFIKCCISGSDSLNTALLLLMHRENEELDEETRLVFSDEISGFIESQFMARIIPTSLPRKLFRQIKEFGTGILNNKDERYLYKIFIEHSNTVMTDLNYFHMKLRRFDNEEEYISSNAMMDAWPGLGVTKTMFIPPTVNEKLLKYSDFVAPFSGLELDRNLFYGHDANLKNDVLPRREILASVTEDVKKMVKQEKMDLLNYMCMRPIACTRLTRIQRSYRNLLRNLNRYEKYVQDYEKGFVLGQIFKFCNLYKAEALMLEDVWEDDIIAGDQRKDRIVRIMKRKTVFAVWCLDHVFEKFLKFDNSYHKREYAMRIQTLYNYVAEKFQVEEESL